MEGLLRPRHRVLAAAALVLLAGGALGLRAVNLGWGLPEVYEEATPVREAVQFWGEPGGSVDLNPHFFNYPSLTFYLQFGVQTVRYFWLSLTGDVESLNDFRQVLSGDLGSAVWHGRLLQALLGALLVFPAFSLGCRLGGAAAGWTAAGLAAVLPAAVESSQVVSPDAALALFGGACLAAAAAVAQTRARRDYLWCGLFLGLAASAKYPGILFLAALLTAHAVASRGKGPAGLVLSSPIWQALTVAAAAFVATSPYVFLDFAAFRADLAFERHHMVLGQLGRESGKAIGFYLSRIPQSWTWSGAGFALAGLGFALWTPERRRGALPSLVAVGLFVGVVGSWRMAAPHYVLPVAVVVCAWAGAGVAWLASWFRGRGRTAAAAVAGLALVVLPGAVSWDQVRGKGREDSRAAATSWIAAQVPDSSAVLLERYGPDPKPSLLALVLPFDSVHPHVYDPAYSPVLYSTFDYIVLSSGVHARYLARPREYPAQVEFYEAVASAFEEVARFEGPEYLGPRIIVYRRPPELAWNDLRGIPEGFFDQLAGNGPLAEYLAQLGGILDRQGRQDLAYRILNAAVDIDPKNGKVWAGLAVAQLADGKFEDSLLSFRKARDLAPDRAEIAFNQGTLFRRMGEMRQASDAYRDALGLDSSFQDAYIALARVLVEDTRYGEARLVLQEFLARFPRSPMRGSAETALRELASMGPGRP